MRQLAEPVPAHALPSLPSKSSQAYGRPLPPVSLINNHDLKEIKPSGGRCYRRMRDGALGRHNDRPSDGRPHLVVAPPVHPLVPQRLSGAEFLSKAFAWVTFATWSRMRLKDLVSRFVP